jgi:NAD(P)H-dependent FMN reductase
MLYLMKQAPLLTISCSLDPNSYSFVLARSIHQQLAQYTSTNDFIDLRTYPLPLCNGTNQSAYAPPTVKELHDRIAQAHGIVLAVPIYNYDVNAACKNLIELTGSAYSDSQSGIAWRHKVIGLVAVAGAEISYMAPTSLLNSLMWDYRCVIIPRYVYAVQTHFEHHTPSAETECRLVELAETMVQFTRGLADYIGHVER